MLLSDTISKLVSIGVVLCLMRHAPLQAQNQFNQQTQWIDLAIVSGQAIDEGKGIVSHLTVAVQGGKIEGEILIHLNGYVQPTLNPCMDTWQVSSCQIAVFDSHQKYLGSLLPCRQLQRGINVDSSIHTQKHFSSGGGFWGRRFSFSPIVIGEENGRKKLADGDYFAQCIVYRAFTDPLSGDLSNEIARSNIEKFSLSLDDIGKSATQDKVKYTPFTFENGKVAITLKVMKKTETELKLQIQLTNNSTRTLEVMPFSAAPHGAMTPHYYLSVETASGMENILGKDFQGGGYDRSEACFLPPGGIIGSTTTFQANNRNFPQWDPDAWKSVQFVAFDGLFAESFHTVSKEFTKREILLRSNRVVLKN